MYERSHGYYLGYKPDIIGAIRFSQESDYDGSRDISAIEASQPLQASCHAEENAEYNGQVVVWGEQHTTVSAGS